MGVTVSTANAGATFVPIATQILPSATNSATFNAIPSGYTDLIVVAQITDATASNRTDVELRYNGDTSAIYSSTIMGGTTSNGTNSQRSTNNNKCTIGMMTNEIGTIILQVLGYSNTNISKPALSRTNVVTVSGGAADYPVGATVGTWRSTSAINSLSIISVQNFVAGSIFTLFGIKAA